MNVHLILNKLGYGGSGIHYGAGGTDTSTYEELAQYWPAGNPPLSGKDVFESTWETVESEIAAEEYKEKRLISGYDNISNQLDMLYWDVYSGKFGDEAKNSQWFLHCSGVKADYPKPL
jgi:hypothetical protein